MAVTSLVVAVRTTGQNSLARLGAQTNHLGNQFTQLGARIRLMANNSRVHFNRMMNQFAARGGIGPVVNRLAAAGRQAGQMFVNNFAAIGKTGMAVVAGPMAAALVAAIGPLIAAGILGALGGGVLAAGIAAAAKDPAVSGAFKTLGDRAKKSFADFGTPFKAPLIRAADTFGAALERMAPSFNRMGAAMAPLIDKLAPALAKMVENSLPGIEKAVMASIPLFEKLAEHAPKIGEAVSKFFEKVAAAGPQAEKVFSFILTAIEKILPVLGSVISGITSFYSTMIGFWTGVKNVAVTAMSAVTNAVLGFVGTLINGAAKAFGWVPGLGPKLKAAAEGFNKFRDDVNRALNGIQDQVVNVDVNYRAVGTAAKNFQVPGAKISSGKLQFKAAGGPVRKGQPYIVGERRPELFVPDQNGTILPRVPGASGARAGVYGGAAARTVVEVAAGPALARDLSDAIIRNLAFRARDAGGIDNLLAGVH